jgi:hypothetical protein
VRAKTIANQYPWFLTSLSFSLGIKHTFKLFQADLGVGIPRFGTRIVLSRSKKHDPVASISNSWPNYY